MREARLGWLSRARAGFMVCLLALSLSPMLCTPAAATMKFGAVQLSGNVETQNLIRNSSVESLQPVQQRNTIRLRVDWDWLQNGQFLDTVSIPFTFEFDGQSGKTFASLPCRVRIADAPGMKDSALVAPTNVPWR